MSGAAQAAREVFKRARRGLFAGKMRLSGNKISEDGGNRQAFCMCCPYDLPATAILSTLARSWDKTCRSRRVWKPNVITKAVYSEALDRMVRLNMTTSALRCVLKILVSLHIHLTFHLNAEITSVAFVDVLLLGSMHA